MGHALLIFFSNLALNNKKLTLPWCSSALFSQNVLKPKTKEERCLQKV